MRAVMHIRKQVLTVLILALLVLGATARRKGRAHKNASEQDQQCKHARNPIIIVPGIMGSDLEVRFMGGRYRAPCSMRKAAKLSLWPPFSPDLLRNSACFMYLLQPVPCNIGDDATGRRITLCNNAGVSMFVNPGGDAGTDTFAFRQGGYTQLTDFLSMHFGYQLGKDLFAAPYDWRLTLPALEEAGQYDVIARRIEDAVQKNCGKKAIVIGHSMGTLVSLGLLQSPHFQEWRSKNVMSYLALAPPYGGSTFAIASKLGGTKINLIDFISDLLQPVINELVYQGSRGLPSMLMLMPYKGIWGKDFVLVSTPSHNYTLGDLTDLFKATGDMQSVRLFNQAQILHGLLEKGPVPDVDTYCIYGAAMPTVQSWRYRAIMQGRPAPVGSADPMQTGLGDGVVNLESMRLCKRLTDSSHIHELGPGVDHGTVLSHPDSLAAIKSVLTQLLSSKGSESQDDEQQTDDGDEEADEDSV